MGARFLLALAGLSFAVSVQDNMLVSDPLQCFNRLDGSPRIAYSLVDVDAPGFTRAWRITTRELGPNAWDNRLRCFATRAAKKGDLGVATYWIRSTREENAIVQFVVEQGADPYSKSIARPSLATREWRKIQTPFRWDKDYTGATSGVSSYNLSFWLNYRTQEVEIGGFELLNYGPNVDPQSLNLTGYPYPGAEADAPWRAAAAARIEQHRKADIEVTVKDGAGNPVADAPVRVRMKRHAFGFATAADCGTINGGSADSQRYRQEILRNFNKVAIENDLKWPFFESWAAGRFDPAEAWLKANSLPIHGHVLVWPGSRNLPSDVQAMLRQNPVNKEALRLRINTHIDQMLDFTRGRLTEWDVLNEPFDNKDVQAVLGDTEMAEWFKRARERDPNILLMLNDYNNVENAGFQFPHSEFTFRTLQRIKADGGPVDAFGFQSHFSGSLADPERIYEMFDQFGSEVDVLQVTEFDVSNVDEDTRARYTRDYLTLSFSHPKMNGFTVWGFWAGRHWRPEAALFKQDWSPTKSLDAWRDLIYREWWTDLEGRTGEDGVFRVRGFLGEYEAEGAGVTKPFSVKGGVTNRVEFQPE